MLCVVRERVAKIMKKREFWQLKKKKPSEEREGKEKCKGKEGIIREKE